MQQVIILHNQIPSDAPEDVLDILRQAQWIAEILTEKGYATTLLPYSLSALEQLEKSVVVFNLVDSAPKEELLSYLVPGILESLHLRYTGCSLSSLFLSTDKVLAKRLLSEHTLPTPALYSKESEKGLYLIKPTTQDASVGLDEQCLVEHDRVQAVLREKEQEVGCPCFAEQYIDGREFTVCMYGTKEEAHILPPYEWVFNDYGQNAKIITYDAKWTENTFGYEHITAKYTHDEADKALLQQLVQISTSCWNVFDLHGYARVDFRVDDQNRPYILELNANPSFYGFYHLAKEWLFSFEDIVLFLVEHPHVS
ncbi:ATP-grasp domain-containing protein [Sphaerochaeta globosa]|uniref:D-alanine--D-alanine ligase domain protein n=1 Tax=Sphaerochaeta globosa (strain ATCC BAA-1886 / DSM 22777 / Buddy) TaxID=158189 RepID=F0RT79_SPHGB|nr:ATP-grasp domain-containing protein [Sphaerochaeta globosa]ADY14384.1 D-alanine--D-alanine ligase domain protein [Sphaerochaeta globosa str. Buddy]